MDTIWTQEVYNRQKSFTRTLEDDSKLYVMCANADGPDTNSKAGGVSYFAKVDSMPWWKMAGAFTSITEMQDFFKICKDEKDFYRLVDLAEGTCLY